MELEQIGSKEQIINMFTKPLPTTSFQEFIQEIPRNERKKNLVHGEVLLDNLKLNNRVVFYFIVSCILKIDSEVCLLKYWVFVRLMKYWVCFIILD